MIIKNKKYVIISNDYPLKFYTGDGCLDDFFEEAVLYESKERVNGELSTFDEPENFRIVEVDITYEFQGVKEI